MAEGGGAAADFRLYQEVDILGFVLTSVSSATFIPGGA